MANGGEGRNAMEKKSKKISSGVVELIDLAIYSFSCILGLKSSDKLRGSPVVLGVMAMFFQMLEVAKESTRAEFQERFKEATVEKPGSFEKAVCSRLKLAKAKKLNETGPPDIPSSLQEKVERFNEATERVRTKCYPHCWRCQERCRFCVLRRKSKPVAPFGSELMSPFLSSLDAIANAKAFPDPDEEEESSMPDGLEEIADDEADKLMERFFKEDKSDDDEKEDGDDDDDDSKDNMSEVDEDA